MYVVNTDKGLYSAVGFDVFNDLASQVFGLGYRIGIERSRISALLIQQNPLLYIYPYAIDYRSYIQRVQNLVDAIAKSIKEGKGGNVAGTIWGHYEALVFKQSAGHYREFLQEKLELVAKALKRDLNLARQVYKIDPYIAVRYDLLDKLEQVLLGYAKAYPSFLIDVSGLQVSDGIANTHTVLTMERQIEEATIGRIVNYGTKLRAGILTLGILTAIGQRLGIPVDIVHKIADAEAITDTDIETQESKIKIKAKQKAHAESTAGQANISTQDQHVEQQDKHSLMEGLDKLLDIFFAKRIELPRRWDDVQRNTSVQVTLTFSANNLLEYITDVLAPIIILQSLAAPAQNPDAILPFLIQTPPGLLVVIPGKVFVPYAIVESFAYTLDPINSANTGHSLSATVSITFANLTGSFVTPATSFEKLGQGSGSFDVFNTVMSAIIGSVFEDPVKKAVYYNNKWISETDETKYSADEKMLYGDSLYMHSKEVKRQYAERQAPIRIEKPKIAEKKQPKQETQQPKQQQVAKKPSAQKYTFELTASYGHGALSAISTLFDGQKIPTRPNCEQSLETVRKQFLKTFGQNVEYAAFNAYKSYLKQKYPDLPDDVITHIARYFTTQYSRYLRSLASSPATRHILEGAELESYLDLRTQLLANGAYKELYRHVSADCAQKIARIPPDKLANVLKAIARHESGFYRYKIGRVDKEDTGFMQVNFKHHGQYAADKVIGYDIQKTKNVILTDPTADAELGFRVYLRNLCAHLKTHNTDPSTYDIGQLALPYHRPAENNSNHPYAQATRQTATKKLYLPSTDGRPLRYVTKVNGKPVVIEVPYIKDFIDVDSIAKATKEQTIEKLKRWHCI